MYPQRAHYPAFGRKDSVGSKEVCNHYSFHQVDWPAADLFSHDLHHLSAITKHGLAGDMSPANRKEKLARLVPFERNAKILHLPYPVPLFAQQYPGEVLVHQGNLCPQVAGGNGGPAAGQSAAHYQEVSIHDFFFRLGQLFDTPSLRKGRAKNL